MKSKGIRISDEDKEISFICVKLSAILNEIQWELLFSWSILYFYGMGYQGKDKSFSELEKQINESENGMFVTWTELNTLALEIEQIFDIVIIGCKDPENLRRYEDDQEMYETCDIVIVMFDGSYWEVFSKDSDLIDRLAVKFKKIEFLEPDFEKYLI